MKANDLKGPLGIDMLHFKIAFESTKVGNKVFTTETIHRVQTDGRAVLSPSTITKWYRRAIR